MIQVKSPLILMCTFLWLGFVCAISFMEAWLKFRAPGITVPLGLGIGRLVFGALNKVEWVLAIAIFICLIMNKMMAVNATTLFFLIPLLILVIQTTWLLPVLDVRAEQYITGKTMAAGNYHIYFIIAELLKVGCLFTFGLKLFMPAV